MKEIFPGVFKQAKDIFTKSLTPGNKVYGEQIAKHGGEEYRRWDPNRSKLGASITNGQKTSVLEKGSKVLYLGAASGTTISHISDIVQQSGAIYAVEFSERPFRDLTNVVKVRKNILPILADARKPEQYDWVEEVDLVFADVAQPDETEITIRNADRFLKIGGYVMIAVKSQSIDVTKDPNQVYKEESEKLKRAAYTIVESIQLDPYETAHAMLIAKK